MELLAYIHHAVVYEEACQSLGIDPASDAQDFPIEFPNQRIFFRWQFWLLVALASLILQTPAMAKTRIVNTNGSDLNVRATPGGEVVGFLRNGASIELTGTQSGEWVQIAGGGYVSAYWLRPPANPTPDSSSAQAKAQEKPAPSKPTVNNRELAAVVRTNGSALNIRATPDGAVTGSLPNGTVVRLTEVRSGEWIQLVQGGYVSANWLRSLEKDGSLSFDPSAQSSVESSVPAPRNPPLQAVVSTNGSGLNVRDRPNGVVIDGLANGTIVSLSGVRSGEWVQLANGGYVSAQWLQ